MIIGSVPYYNALPLTANLKLKYKVKKYSPTDLVGALLNAEIGLGLVPVYSILKQGLCSYPQAGLIGCDGEIKSVKMFAKNNIELVKAKTIYFDKDSQTAVRLAKIILNEHVKNISYQEISFEKRSEADVQMLIGDKALFFDNPNYRYWDLGTLWKEMTGHGFIFACWASQNPLDASLIQELKTAKVPSQKIPEILTDIEPQKRKIIQNYLQKNIIYDLSDSLKKGHEEFRGLVEKLKL